MKKLVNLIADLSVIPRNGVPTKLGADGKTHYCLDFEIKVTFFSAHMEFSLWYEGKEYGKVKAEFD